MTDKENPATRSTIPGMTLKELIQGLLRHWILIGSIWGTVLILVLAWTFLSAPRFQSTAVVRIMDDPSKLGLAQQFGDFPGAGLLGLGQEDVETEVGILKSWRITEAVVDSLVLGVELRKPVGIRSDILEILGSGEVEREADLTLEHQGGGRYSVEVEEKGEDRQSLEPISVGGTVEYSGYRLSLVPDPSQDLPGSIRIKLLPRYEAVTELREDLTVRRQELGSNLLEVSITLTDRELAADIVNAVVREYVAYKTRVEGSEARFTADQLQKEVLDYSQRLAGAEERLRAYQEEHRIVAPEEEATQQVRRFAEIQIRKDALEVERTALDQLLGIIEDRVKAGPQGAPDPAGYRQLATFPSLITNQAIQDLLMGLLDLENERSTLLVLRTEENRDVRQLTARIAELETQLFRLGTDYLESLEGQLEAVQATLDGISAELEKFPEKEMEYLRLFRDRSVLNEAYVMLQAQLQFAEVQDAIRDEGVRIVDRGIVAHEDDPEYPKPLVNLFLGMVLGFALGVSAALVRDLW